MADLRYAVIIVILVAKSFRRCRRRTAPSSRFQCSSCDRLTHAPGYQLLSSQQDNDSFDAITRFGRTGLSVPAASRALTGKMARAKSFASFSVAKVLVSRR
jgi:hypothetical protein